VKNNRNHSLVESARALAPGRWITRRGIKVYEFDQPALTFIDAEPWPAIKLCGTCDTAHPRDQSCPTCVAWAERAAERHLWEQRRRANRGQIWDILDARKSVAA
jgi:hypothetical protein